MCRVRPGLGTVAPSLQLGSREGKGTADPPLAREAIRSETSYSAILRTSILVEHLATPDDGFGSYKTTICNLLRTSHVIAIRTIMMRAMRGVSNTSHMPVRLSPGIIMPVLGSNISN